MQVHHFSTLILALLWVQSQGLKIACGVMWIEHTPLPYTANNFYKGGTTSVISGGVPNLRDSTVDLAGNAVTQGLKYYVRNRNYRLIGIIVEVTYRLVANKAAGISTLADLRDKRIGTVPGTSAEVFVHQLLASAGVSQSEYTTVSGKVCMREPCGADTLPSQLKDRRIDAFGVWETSVELGIRALGDVNTVVFKNSSIYREIYSLYTTEEKLRDPITRHKIVKFVRALNQTYDVYKNTPTNVYGTVANIIDVDVPAVESVWADHVWGPGSLGKDLVNFLEYEDRYLAKADKRQPFSRADLERFVDVSVYEEAMQD